MEGSIFDGLFVLEMANNHWGSVEKGKKIISDFSEVAKNNGIKTAIKLQMRDGENFVHKDFRNRNDIVYIKKVMNSIMRVEDYSELVTEIKKSGLISASTPFDEVSARNCLKIGIDIIKIASANITDKPLIEEISKTGLPVIISTGGAKLEDIDSIVKYFESKNIEIAINHCVSKYPTTKNELELNKIDFLKNRYSKHIIGFSTHEYNQNLETAMYIAYAKGARTYERHIDIQYGDNQPFKYCSMPEDIDKWMKAYKCAKEICGRESNMFFNQNGYEEEYIQSVARGVYAKRDLEKGTILTENDIYYAVPLINNQISSKEMQVDLILTNSCGKDGMILKSDVKKASKINI